MKKTMTEKIIEFVQYKNEIGVELKVEKINLISFGKFMDFHYPGKPLTAKRAIEWATRYAKSENRINYAKRLGLLRPLSKFLAISDSRTELVPNNYFGSTRSRTDPYIYTSEEIARLLKTDPYTKPYPLSHLTLSTILGLLACTGMRVGESLALKRNDVDMKNRTIFIRQSKRKQRTIPISCSAMTNLQKYALRRNEYIPDAHNDHFFQHPAKSGRSYRYGGIVYIWKTLLRKAEIGIGRKKQPRVHDLRHTFACNHLLAAYENGMDIDVAVQQLSCYLGHSHICDTYWYLTGVPALLKIGCERFENQIIQFNQKTQ